MAESEDSKLDDVIFHGQAAADQQQIDVLLEQYKLFVDTSERLVARRQMVNTFFCPSMRLFSPRFDSLLDE